ncbi:hypothetical protein O181_133664 [Austropuccinia psidii MF-1]|uniref:Uncharacterized protein n=1 Tax=Austropuccinia psidii MF-1 TaxID=1389203 RepID=A0A9Q3L8X0_9BASI|nr:hypothetical protein [Austropuccinia psidii MF-1]
MFYHRKQSNGRNYNHAKNFKTKRITITIFKAPAFLNSAHFTKRVNINEKDSSLLQEEISKNSTPIVKIRPKYFTLWIDGKEVERFIKIVENIAKIEGSSARDIARQISFWTKDQEGGYHIE